MMQRNSSSSSSGQQPEEVPQNDFEPKIQSNSPGISSDEQELFQATISYQNKVKEIRSHNLVVEKSAEDVNTSAGAMATVREQLKKQFEDFCKSMKLVECIEEKDPSVRINEMRQLFANSFQNLSQMAHEFDESCLKLYQSKRVLEQEHAYLVRKEGEVGELRENLKKVHDELDMKTEFKTDVDTLSKQFYVPQQINEERFISLLVDESVQSISNIATRLESSQQEYIEVNINRSLQLDSLHLTRDFQTGREKCLTLLLQNDNISIVFKNCVFKGVGLVLICQNNSQHTRVVFHDVSVTNTISSGLDVRNFSECSLENVSARFTGQRGIQLKNINTCIIQNCTANDSRKSGYYFDNVNGTMKNCSANNCKNYGVVIKGTSSITRQDVEIANSGILEISGTFVNS